MTSSILVHDFSHTLHHWAHNYFTAVNDLSRTHPGISMFAVKYNNACLAFELTIKSHIAYTNHAGSPGELDVILRSYGHSIMKLVTYAEQEIGVKFQPYQEDALRLVDSYYSKHHFRYPPYEPRKSNLNHQQLLSAIAEMCGMTGILLAVVHDQTNGFVLPDKQ